MTSTATEAMKTLKTVPELWGNDENDWQLEEFTLSLQADHSLSLSSEQLERLAIARPVAQEWFEDDEEDSPF